MKLIKCPLCKGIGSFFNALDPSGTPCGLCNGTGKVNQKKRMQYVRDAKIFYKDEE